MANIKVNKLNYAKTSEAEKDALETITAFQSLRIVGGSSKCWCCKTPEPQMPDPYSGA